MFNSRLKLFLLLSLVVHIVLLTLSFKEKLIIDSVAKKEPEETAIQIKLQDTKKQKMQIVENVEKKEDRKPIETKFLSKKDQVNERQTVARNKGKFEEARHGGSAAQQLKKQSQSKKVTDLKNLKLSELAPIKKPDFKQQETGRQGLAGSVGAGSGIITKSSDYIEDIPLGDMTRLNTIEYKYYGFYHRIRQRLEQHWGASLQEKALVLAKKGKRMPSSVEKITSLAIVLSNEGKILQIYLRSTSGVEELDDAAMEAFYKAGPFPNPPRGLIKDGVAKIEWGFVVKS